MRTHIAHYEIVSELGRGGMGVVYKAYEPALTRYVAIKELSPALAHEQSLIERFLREARAMASLNDPHIIQIYFIGQEEGQPFFVMEFVEGESLSAIIKSAGRLDAEDALKIVHQAAQGLATAHEKGVVHRDIKPGNLMLTQRGQIKLADFGIALANHEFDSKLTGTGQFVGTPGYLSPEVCLGRTVDHRSDIFALGVVLFEMLTGRIPFFDESPLKLMLAVVEEQIPDIRGLNDSVDEDVSRVLGRMLEKDPANRYPSCAALIQDLERLPQVAKGGGLRIQAKPLSGAAATMIAPTPQRQPQLRAPTPPPDLGASKTPAASMPPVMAQTPAGPAPAMAASEPATRPSLSAAAPPRVNRWMAGALASVALAVLAVGGAWAWKAWMPGPTTETAAASAAQALGQPDATADSTATLDEGPDSGAPMDSPSAGQALPDSSSSQSSTSMPVEAPAATASVTPESKPSPSLAAKPRPVAAPAGLDTAVDTGDDDAAADDDDTAATGPLRGRTLAIVVRGDSELTAPAKRLIVERLRAAGFRVVPPRAARWMLEIDARVVDRQTLEFHGQSDVVTTANFSVRAMGRDRQPLGPGISERIDYTPVNAEDKVTLVIEDGIDRLLERLQE